MFDVKKITFRIKTGPTYVVVPSVEVICWVDFSEYDFYTGKFELDNFQLSQITIPAWAECFRKQIVDYIQNNKNSFTKQKDGAVVNVD